ncbi:MAG TPA: DUF4330 domain-containing protein [Tepidimicrobium sp.]|nr:DUF4330 domain-containing protein [Tepidimicrobium sp.]
MKIIDEKGKLFGLINIIDLGVILLLILLVLGGARRMGRGLNLAGTKPATIEVEVSDIKKNIVEALMVGDPIYHYGKDRKFGDIVDKQVEPYKKEAKAKDGSIVMKEVSGKYTVILTIKSDVHDDPNAIMVGGEQTRVDSSFKFENKNVEFSGKILSIEME